MGKIRYPCRRYYKPYDLTLEFSHHGCKALIISVSADQAKTYPVGSLQDFSGPEHPAYKYVPWTKRAVLHSMVKKYSHEL